MPACSHLYLSIVPEAVNAGIVAGLGLVAADQQLDRHVADADGRSRTDDVSREFVLGVLAAVPDLGVQAFDAFLVPGSITTRGRCS